HLQGRRDWPRAAGARTRSLPLPHGRAVAPARGPGRGAARAPGSRARPPGAAARDRCRAALLPGLELGDRLRAPGRQCLVDDALRAPPDALPRPCAGRDLPRPRRARLTACPNYTRCVSEGSHGDTFDRRGVRIEPWGEADLPLLQKCLGDPAMMEHLGGAMSPEQIVERQRRYERTSGAGEGRMFKIIEAASGTSVGSVGY